ncbi:MAG TPA: peptidase M61 [Ohtaekwangia sp.]|nr:peptidase M61 [Ohtaekwangia sp.]
MRLYFMFIVFFAMYSTLPAQNSKNNKYRYSIDLTRVAEDRVLVTLTPPTISESEILFYMPKIVPGTYAIADYGRYVHDFTVVDKKGNKLPVEKIDENTWKITRADKATQISYWVDDTIDTTMTGANIFAPAGTSFESGTNFFMNTSGLFGYFEGLKEVPFQFNVVRTTDFYGTTGLIPVESGVAAKSLKREKKSNSDAKTVVDVYQTSDYDELIDSPLMYSKPDTAVVRVANAEVLIGSYSPNKKISAKEIAASIREILEAQSKFLGGELPVQKYAFIFYFTDQITEEAGALEHSYSSMYYLPEMPIQQLDQQLRDIAAHEFFHIVTPLTVHSEHIENFDFNDPKMSKHLWMYEGVTEYFASSVQVRYGLISPEEFLLVMQDKMVNADRFMDTIPFTDISRYTIEKYHDQYLNVYQKGALIGMCLDIRLRKLSSGKLGLRDLMLDLSKKYGKNKAFKDDELFKVITEMTYPEIGEFFNRYVKGPEPLPYEEVLTDVGIDYLEAEKFEDYSLGITNADIGVTQVENKPKLQIASTAQQNAMGKAIGLKEGDVLLKINHEPLPDLGPDLGMFVQKHFRALPETDTLSYTVLREDENKAKKEVVLSAPVTTIEITRKHQMQFNEAATPEQLALREAWLKAE